MIKTAIRNILKKFGYDIIKTYSTSYDKYKVSNNSEDLNFYNTPVGKYFFPKNLEKDLVVNTIKRGKYFEPEVINLVKSYIKPNTSLLDVGANFGQMSIEFSKSIGGGEYIRLKQNQLWQIYYKKM